MESYVVDRTRVIHQRDLQRMSRSIGESLRGPHRRQGQGRQQGDQVAPTMSSRAVPTWAQNEGLA